jgi:hypothetical protein
MRLLSRLDDLLSSRFASQVHFDPIVRHEELPPRLHHCITNLRSTCVWRAHRTTEGVFCAIARAPIGPARSAGYDMEVYLIDDVGRAYCAAVWAHDREHGWWLDSVLSPSFDGQYGWWLGPLMVASDSALSDADPVPQIRRIMRAM